MTHFLQCTSRIRKARGDLQRIVQTIRKSQRQLEVQQSLLKVRSFDFQDAENVMKLSGASGCRRR